MRIAHCRHGDYHGVKNEKGCNLRKDTRRGLLLDVSPGGRCQNPFKPCSTAPQRRREAPQIGYLVGEGKGA